MTSPQAVFRVRAMQLMDVEQVHAIDQMSFALPWPKNSYSYEIMDNSRSRCWVAEPVQQDMVLQGIVAMAVTWLVIDEMHIATIAVHPEFRGLGIAKQLMVVIMDSAKEEGMVSVTLEVRASNQAAQALYRQFGFEEVGRRIRYYQDNQEDALIMTVMLEK